MMQWPRPYTVLDTVTKERTMRVCARIAPGPYAPNAGFFGVLTRGDLLLIDGR